MEKSSDETGKKSAYNRENKILLRYLTTCVLGHLPKCAFVYSCLLPLPFYSNAKVTAYTTHTSDCSYSNKPVTFPGCFAIGCLYGASWIMLYWQEVLKQQKTQGLMDLPSPLFM